MVFQEESVTLEQCKEIIVVFEPQQEMKKAGKMSLIGKQGFFQVTCIARLSRPVRLGVIDGWAY